MKTKFLFAPLSLALSILAPSAFADDSVSTLVNRADNANSTVLNLAGPNAPADAAVPRALIAQSVCIVTIPGYKKAGFVFGGSYGAGLASCRNAQGQFDTPFYVTLVGGSWGLQIGVQSTDLMLVMTEKNAQAELTAAGGIKLGVEGSLTIGPIGRDATAGTSANFQEATFSYSTSVGIFAGLTLNGSDLSWDSGAQAVIPSSPAITQALVNYQAMLNSLQ
jgi:lipid-binding SYLF domain-containing protein